MSSAKNHHTGSSAISTPARGCRRQDQMTALSDVVPWLICPLCQSELDRRENSLVCSAGHSFDVARHGYVNLLNTKQPANADTLQMVQARERFLDLGHYRPIAQALIEATDPGKRIIEVGAGTAYYLAMMLDARPEALGLASDISVMACRRAARAHNRLAAVVADTWLRLPLSKCSVDTVLCIFAPRNPAEFLRVLSPGGQVAVAFPDQDHLASLRASHGLLRIHQAKAEELARSFHSFEVISTEHLRYDIDLDAAGVSDLIGMGPNAFHQHYADQQPTRTTVSVKVMVFGKPEL